MNSEYKKPSFLNVIISVLAAMFGVQSGKARQRDFTQGKPWIYALVGVVMTGLFVLAVLLVVKVVLQGV